MNLSKLRRDFRHLQRYRSHANAKADPKPWKYWRWPEDLVDATSAFEITACFLSTTAVASGCLASITTGFPATLLRYKSNTIYLGKMVSTVIHRLVFRISCDANGDLSMCTLAMML